MPDQKHLEQSAETIANIIRVAGGELVGRTRLQKIVYLLSISGLVDGFEYEYRHYGPYSEAVSFASNYARLEGLIQEEERQASWGGRYSTFRAFGSPQSLQADRTNLEKILKIASGANAVALELAATAAFLALEGYNDPWEETESRKPEKASQIPNAKNLYIQLQAIPTPKRLPSIV